MSSGQTWCNRLVLTPGCATMITILSWSSWLLSICNDTYQAKINFHPNLSLSIYIYIRLKHQTHWSTFQRIRYIPLACLSHVDLQPNYILPGIPIKTTPPNINCHNSSLHCTFTSWTGTKINGTFVAEPARHYHQHIPANMDSHNPSLHIPLIPKPNPVLQL